MMAGGRTTRNGCIGAPPGGSGRRRELCATGLSDDAYVTDRISLAFRHHASDRVA